MYVEDASGPCRDIEGIRWSENRASVLDFWNFAALVEGRAYTLRREPGDPHPRGWSLVVARAASGTSAQRARVVGVCWRRSETPPRGQVWTKTDRYCDFGGAACIGMAYDYSGEIVVALRWVEPGEPPLLPPNDCRVLLLAFLPFGANRVRRKIRVWREIVELLTETSTDNWPVAGFCTLSWCVRFLDRRLGGPLDWHGFWRSTLKLGEARLRSRVSRTRLAPVGKGPGVHICSCACLEDVVRQVQMVECVYLHSHQDNKGRARAASGISGGCTLRWDAPRVGRPHGLPRPFWTS